MQIKKGSLIKTFTVAAALAFSGLSTTYAQERKTSDNNSNKNMRVLHISANGETRLLEPGQQAPGSQSQTTAQYQQQQQVQAKPWANDPGYQRELQNIKTAYEIDLAQLDKKEETAHMRADRSASSRNQSARNQSANNAKRVGRVYQNKNAGGLDKAAAIFSASESIFNAGRVKRENKNAQDQISLSYEEARIKLEQAALKKVEALDARKAKELGYSTSGQRTSSASGNSLDSKVQQQLEKAYLARSAADVKAGRMPPSFDEYKAELEKNKSNHRPSPKR